MRPFDSSTLILTLLSLALTILASPIPVITPAAPDAQHIVELMRLKGVTERAILTYLSSPNINIDPDVLSASGSQRSVFGSFFSPSRGLHEHERDGSGDISPTTLDAPELLPRPAPPETTAEAAIRIFSGILHGRIDRREFAYEGKESEMKRPEGMRYWGYGEI